ncbi:MAG: hypothetical protein C0490_24020, partial [Marivirga sp.]|nr:hypothetical protein [Marivirga sp.]
EDDVTDLKFQLDDKKKLLSSRFDHLTKDKRKILAKTDYFFTRRSCQSLVEQHGTDAEKSNLTSIIQHEKQLMAAENPFMLESVVKKLERLAMEIRWRVPEHLIAIYYYFSSLTDEYKDAGKANSLKEKGDRALERKNYDELRVVINSLHALLPEKEQQKSQIKGTGIQ